MFDNLSNDDITTALDELITYFGVKEEMPYYDLLVFLCKKDTQGCVQEIAIRLGLPIRISLSYVPKNFKPGNTDCFQTSTLTRTDWTGRGIGSITAQVSIPQHLPMFGTSGLEGYPISVRVSEKCHEHPETFVAIMAHELSHVLLASLCHPQKDSELHTDPVPILLGFHDVVRRGRKTVQSTTIGNVTTTRTDTYGYLTDSQFDFACNYVRGILTRHQRQKKHLTKVVAKLRRELRVATRHLAMFCNYVRYLDTHPVVKMNQDDALRIVQFHAWNYTREWETGVSQVGTSLEKAERFLQPLSHYTNSAVEQLERHIKNLSRASEQLHQLMGDITRDVRTLRRYVPLLYWLWNTLWRRWAPNGVDKDGW